MANTPQTTLTTETVTQPRSVEQIVAGQATSDGDGVKLTRVLTQHLQRRLDPFLMLDAFGTDQPEDYIGGFPDHPHRGFETVTYMLQGRMRHRDSAGNEGLLAPGGVQWMTAGKGVIHSELPEQEEGAMEGFQLWLNLAASQKMVDPSYRDLQREEIPEFTTADGVNVRVIAGASHGVAGAIQREITEPLYLDVHLPAGAQFTQAIAADFNAFVYVYQGEIELEGQRVPQQRMAILKTTPDDDGVIVQATQQTRLLLIAGRPLREPIAQYGPFVMNTQEQIFEAIRDFREGRFA